MIKNSTIYNKVVKDELQGLQYLVLWKDYFENKKIRNLVLTIIQLEKMIGTFHKDQTKKRIAISPLIDSALPMARSTVNIQQKHSKARSAEPAKEAKLSLQSYFWRFSMFLSSEPIFQSLYSKKNR